jgi:single-stranded-DNA-specific exonuclease
MIENQEHFNSFLSAVAQAARLIRRHAKNNGLIHVVSHLDADGLAAAGILGKALTRLDATFRIRIERWLDEKVIESILAGQPSLIVFADFGSGDLDQLNSKLSEMPVIILDHHQPMGQAASSFVQVNPHLHEIDGSRDLSGAGVAYFVAKTLDKANMDMAVVAVVGALGDLQDKYDQKKLGGPNAFIMEDAVNSGFLGVETDLLFFGRETRPIHKALACTTTPYISGISGEEDKSLAFLANLSITPKRDDRWRALRDLSEDEKKRLFNALAEYLMSKGLPSDLALSLRGNIYTLTHEEPWTFLRDAREFSVLLNATGRSDRPSLGVAICMGDRCSALEEAKVVLKEYRRTVTKYLNWLMEPNTNRIDELKNIYVVRGDSTIDNKVIATISTMLSTNLPKLEKPLIAYAIINEEDLAKISARTIDLMVRKGLNLGKILQVAAEKYSGKGGGHNIAAGAQVPIRNLESFLKLVDELVKEQLEESKIAS